MAVPLVKLVPVLHFLVCFVLFSICCHVGRRVFHFVTLSSPTLCPSTNLGYRSPCGPNSSPRTNGVAFPSSRPALPRLRLFSVRLLNFGRCRKHSQVSCSAFRSSCLVFPFHSFPCSLISPEVPSVSFRLFLVLLSLFQTLLLQPARQLVSSNNGLSSSRPPIRPVQSGKVPSQLCIYYRVEDSGKTTASLYPRPPRLPRIVSF